MTDLADRLEEASRGWEAAYLNIASALFAEAAREYRAALRRVEALEAGLREIALNQVEVFDEDLGCNVWVSMDAEEMAGKARALMEKTNG